MKNFKTLSLLIIFLLIFPFIAFNQSDQETLDTYWKYRDKLRKDFVKIGNAPGESIPAVSRRPGVGKNQTWYNSSQDSPSSLKYSDAGITIGQYLCVLATEYRLLQDNNQNTEATLSEIYYSLESLNRLDLKAETYLSEEVIAAGLDNLNGLLLRDDVPEFFYDKYQNDYSQIFDRDFNFNSSHSDYFSYEENPLAGPVPFNPGNVMSLDQIVSIMSGLYMVNQLVDAGTVLPEGETQGFTPAHEARVIARRIIDRLHDDAWVIFDHDGSTIDGLIPHPTGNLVPRGFSCLFYAPQLIEMVENMWPVDLGESSYYESPNFITIVREKNDGSAGFFISPSTTLQVEINLNNLDEVWRDIGHEYQPDIWLENTDFDACSLPGSLLLQQIIDDFTVDQLIELLDDISINLGPIEIAASTCDIVTNVAPDAVEEKLLKVLNEDNVHMFLELNSMADFWPNDYLNTLSVNSGMYQYDLMNAVMYNNSNPYPHHDQAFYYNLLKDVPCTGPYASPDPNNPNDIAGFGWASRDRLIHPKDAYTGTLNNSVDPVVPSTTFNGEFAGLDFMLYYNLYHLLWDDQLPEYKRDQNCECVEECTTFNDLDHLLEVNIKFPEYKDWNIPIESFLAHDLNVIQDGFVSVGNDLLLCGGDELDDTVLAIENGGEVNITGDRFSIKLNPYSEIRIQNGGILNTLNQGESIIEIKENSRIVVESGGTLILESTDQLLIHQNAELILEPGSIVIIEGQIINHGLITLNSILNIEDEGQVSIEQNAIMTHSLSSEIHLNGNETKLDLHGHLDFQTGHIFEVYHDGFDSGSIRMFGNGHQFRGMDQIRLKGDGPNDIMIEVMDNSYFRADWMVNHIKLEDCKIVLNEDAKMDPQNANGCFFESINCGFNGSTSDNYGLRLTHSNLIESCRFSDVTINCSFGNSQLNVDLCEFHGSNNKIFVGGGRFNISNSYFNEGGDNNTAVMSMYLSGISKIDNCHFNSTHDSSIALDDQSDVMIQIKKSSFNGYDLALLNGNDGEFRVRCCEFSNNNIAIFAGQYSILNMGTNAHAGYNKFINNSLAIKLAIPLQLGLKNGFNEFNENGGDLFTGVLLGSCETNGVLQTQYLDANQNVWGNNNGPNPALINLQIPQANNNYTYCDLLVFDDYPTTSQLCGSKDGPPVVIRPPRKSLEFNSNPTEMSWIKTNDDPSNPILDTEFFDNICLDSALVFSAMQMSLYDDLGDDQYALNLFHDILTSDLDRENMDIRWKMDWGQNAMKVAFETTFVNNELDAAGNIIGFAPNTASYVEVLNSMTDSIVTDSSYVDQFYLEIEKAQMFRTIGNLDMALLLLDQIGNCQIDSTEQSHVNYWLTQVQEEILINQDVDAYFNDSLVFNIDTTSYIVPTEFMSDHYYFGSFINGPNNITVVPCEMSNRNYIAVANDLEISLFPNPNDGNFFVLNRSEEIIRQIEIQDSNGRTVYNQLLNLHSGQKQEVKVRGISPGIYSLKANSALSIKVMKIIIN